MRRLVARNSRQNAYSVAAHLSQALHRVEEQAAEAVGVYGDGDFGIGETAPLAAPVDDRRAGREPSCGLDVHRGGARFDERRIERDRDRERVVHGEDALAQYFFHALEIEARRIFKEARQLRPMRLAGDTRFDRLRYRSRR